MNKKLIRLTESDLHRIVRKSVNKILRESEITFRDEDGRNLEYANQGVEILGGLLTGLDEDTANKVAQEIKMHWGEDFENVVESLNSFLDPTPYSDYNPYDPDGEAAQLSQYTTEY